MRCADPSMRLFRQTMQAGQAGNGCAQSTSGCGAGRGWTPIPLSSRRLPRRGAGVSGRPDPGTHSTAWSSGRAGAKGGVYRRQRSGCEYSPRWLRTSMHVCRAARAGCAADTVSDHIHTCVGCTSCGLAPWRSPSVFRPEPAMHAAHVLAALEAREPAAAGRTLSGSRRARTSTWTVCPPSSTTTATERRFFLPNGGRQHWTRWQTLARTERPDLDARRPRGHARRRRGAARGRAALRDGTRGLGTAAARRRERRGRRVVGGATCALGAGETGRDGTVHPRDERRHDSAARVELPRLADLLVGCLEGADLLLARSPAGGAGTCVCLRPRRREWLLWTARSRSGQLGLGLKDSSVKAVSFAEAGRHEDSRGTGASACPLSPRARANTLRPPVCQPSPPSGRAPSAWGTGILPSVQSIVHRVHIPPAMSPRRQIADSPKPPLPRLAIPPHLPKSKHNL